MKAEVRRFHSPDITDLDVYMPLDPTHYAYRDDAGHGPAKDQPLGRPDYESWLGELLPQLHAADPVLDLGCGCGVPATAILAEHHGVTGVDLSPVQISRARRLVPAAQFQ